MIHAIDIYRAGRLIASVPPSATLRDLETLRVELIDAGTIPPDSYLKARKFDRTPAHV